MPISVKTWMASRPDVAGARAGAFNFEPVAGVVAQDAFRHLTPGGITRAKNQHAHREFRNSSQERSTPP